MLIGLTSGSDMEETAAGLWQTFAHISASKVFSAVIAAAVSLLAVKVLLMLLDRAFRRSHLTAELKKLIRGILKAVMLFVAVILTLDCLDIQVTSLVAVLSVAGLAFSLALQNFLSNVAGGMQLLASQPFKVGDFVEAGGCSGTVREMGLFYTKLTSPDNKLLQLPNSTIVSANIINYTSQPTRRVELKVAASYDAPPDTVKEALARVVNAHPLVLGDPEPAIRVNGYGDNAIEYVIRVWCANGDYWTVYYDLLEGVKPAFDAAGVEMTYPHVNIHMLNVGQTKAIPTPAGEKDKKI